MYWFVGEAMVSEVVYYYMTWLSLSPHIPEMAKHASHSSGIRRYRTGYSFLIMMAELQECQANYKVYFQLLFETHLLISDYPEKFIWLSPKWGRGEQYTSPLVRVLQSAQQRALAIRFLLLEFGVVKAAKSFVCHVFQSSLSLYSASEFVSPMGRVHISSALFPFITRVLKSG